MLIALSLWRLFPREIEGALSRFHHRDIAEWMRDDFTMSSAEMLALLDETPADSKFKEASERTFRISEFMGKLVLHRPTVRSADGVLLPAQMPAGAVQIAEFVDWTHDRKIAARHAKETAALRMELRRPGEGYELDFTGLDEPLPAILAARRKKQSDQMREGAKSVIRNGLFAKKGR